MITDNLAGIAEGMTGKLSLNPFLSYLEKQSNDETGGAKNYFQYYLDQLNLLCPRDFDINNLSNDDQKKVFAIISQVANPAIVKRADLYWGISVPGSDDLIYSSEGLTKVLAWTAGDIIVGNVVKIRSDYGLDFIYRLVLERFYDVGPRAFYKPIISYADPLTGLTKIFSIEINGDFVAIQKREGAPELSSWMLEEYLPYGDDIESISCTLNEILPLERFNVEGLAMVSLKEITVEHSVYLVRKMLAENVYHNFSPENFNGMFNAVIGEKSIEFKFIPFLEMNDKPIHFSIGNYSSILYKMDPSQEESGYLDLLFSEFRESPFTLITMRDALIQVISPLLDCVRKSAIESYALFPVYTNGKLIGAMEAFTHSRAFFSSASITSLQLIIPVAAEIISYSHDEFKRSMEMVIREKFTAIQSSVLWKFKTVAWDHIKSKRSNGDNGQIGPVDFKEVFPFYGAIDVKDSTTERKKAIASDAEAQLLILTNLFSDIGKNLMENSDTLLSEFKRVQKKLVTYNGQIPEPVLQKAICSEIHPFLLRVSNEVPPLHTVIVGYFQQTKDQAGILFFHQRQYDFSMQEINSALSNYFDHEFLKLKTSFSFYFDRFRTDGMEYDLYAGQSISGNRLFSKNDLDNIQAWQLSSMAHIACLTKRLSLSLPVPLVTTQLIFVHSPPIDISFRRDEKRFDVEGGYNIRYHVIKKRIDKVKILNTAQRLTRVGSIAIVYENEEDIIVYRSAIQRLREKGGLLAGIEVLELEPLQGIDKLKALRVNVDMDADWQI